MGVWSAIGKGLSMALPFIPVPGAGALGKVLSTAQKAIPAIGQVAAGASKGRAEGRVAEAGANYQQDYLRQIAAKTMEDALMNRAGLDLQRRQFQLGAPGQRGATSVQGDILANAQDASIRGPITRTRGQMPQIRGGLRPSLMSGSTRQLGSEMSRQALLSQMQGDQFESMPAPSMPSPTPLPQAGGLDKFLNVVGGVGAGFGALDESGALDQWKKPQIPPIGGMPPSIPLPSFGAPPKRPQALNEDVWRRIRFNRPPTGGLIDPRTYGGTPTPGVMY